MTYESTRVRDTIHDIYVSHLFYIRDGNVLKVVRPLEL